MRTGTVSYKLGAANGKQILHESIGGFTAEPEEPEE